MILITGQHQANQINEKSNSESCIWFYVAMWHAELSGCLLIDGYKASQYRSPCVLAEAFQGELRFDLLDDESHGKLPNSFLGAQSQETYLSFC